MNPHRLEIGGKGKLYNISTVKEFYTRNVQMDVDDALRIVYLDRMSDMARESVGRVVHRERRNIARLDVNQFRAI